MQLEIVERLKAAAPEAFRGQPVVAAYLFGSQATGRVHAGSDIDVAVLIREKADSLDAMLRLPGRLADSSGLSRIEVLVLNEAGLSIQGRVVTEGVLFYSSDEPIRIRFEGVTRKLNQDFEIHAGDMRRAYFRNIAAGKA